MASRKLGHEGENCSLKPSAHCRVRGGHRREGQRHHCIGAGRGYWKCHPRQGGPPGRQACWAGTVRGWGGLGGALQVPRASISGGPSPAAPAPAPAPSLRLRQPAPAPAEHLRRGRACNADGMRRQDPSVSKRYLCIPRASHRARWQHPHRTAPRARTLQRSPTDVRCAGRRSSVAGTHCIESRLARHAAAPGRSVGAQPGSSLSLIRA